MIRRYATKLQWPIYFATEVPEDPVAKQLESELQVKILPLPAEKAGFLESREAALRLLPSEILYVLPLQEDFLLDRAPDYSALSDALFILDTDRMVSSLRLMPCPGPMPIDTQYVKEKEWRILGNLNIYMFTYQATLWRKMDILTFYSSLLSSIQKDFGDKSETEKKYVALTSNIGENHYGQKLIRECLKDVYHLAWPRAHRDPNAVYMCPWPYRPTAVTRGRLESWAVELFQREGVKFERPIGNMLE